MAAAPVAQAGPPSRPAPLAYAACAAAVLLWLAIAGESSRLASWGYLPAERIWDGAPWALVTSALVHLALWHLVFNVYWLWILGGAVERIFGSAKWLTFVLGAAFVSSASQLAVSGDTGIGASGVVYALFGLMWRSKDEVPHFSEVLGKNTAPVFLVWLVACLVATMAGTVQVGNAAHITGLLFGVLVAEWRIHRSHRNSAAVATVLLTLVSLCAALGNPWSSRRLAHFGIQAYRYQDYEHAVWAFQRSLALGADSAWAFHSLALTYFAMGDTAHSTETLHKLRDLAPGEADSLKRSFEAIKGQDSGL
jgi:membrane associated rhomboid family serine protease